MRRYSFFLNPLYQLPHGRVKWHLCQWEISRKSNVQCWAEMLIPEELRFTFPGSALCKWQGMRSTLKTRLTAAHICKQRTLNLSPFPLWLGLMNSCGMQDCDPAEGCQQHLAADTAPIFSKNNVEAFVFEINRHISQNLSHRHRSKPRVVQAD